MPYAFAHPAAAIPLARLLGPRAVPSALVLGSMTPDVWYFLPFLARADTHRASGLLACLPAALFAYLAFHLVLKQPLAALLPAPLQARLQPWTRAGLPAASWAAVLGSLALGIATHLAWDALTHAGLLSRRFPALAAEMFHLAGEPFRVYQVLQHASTVLGALFVAAWVLRRLRAVPPAPLRAPRISPRARLAVLCGLAAIGAGAFACVLLAIAPPDLDALRDALRAAAVSAVSALGLATLAYCAAWRRL